MTRIIVHIEGGLAEVAYCDDPSVEVIVADEDDDMDPEISVSSLEIHPLSDMETDVAEAVQEFDEEEE